MIFGECPYCDGQIATACAPRTPAFSKEKCGSCGNEYWLKHSRIEPEAYTAEAFLDEYEVDEETRAIKRRGKNDQ